MTTERLKAVLADRYTIERELGQGGMATVYLAQDLRHHRQVAIKVLRPELAAVIGAERFLGEIRTTATLQHPHILPLFDSGEADSFLYYVMPYVEGESLRQRLERERQLPVADAVRIATEIASALDYAHRRGVIHRDIKPENVMLHDGQALVADFGIALAVANTSGSRMTETGMSLGTPHYMSPEQAMGEREITARSDVYALGCVLYEMLAGEPPFTGPTAQAIVARVMTEEPRSLTLQRKTIPPHLEAAVNTALQKLPADRFASAAEFAAALGNPSFAGTAGRAGAALAGRPRVRALPWVVAGAAIVVAGLVAWRSARPGPAPHTVQFLIRPLAGETHDGHVAIAPDGRFVVYRATRDGISRLYRRNLDSPERLPLPGTEGAIFPTVSPDGRWVAFVGPDASLMKVPLDGGRPVRIARMDTPALGLSWSERHGLVLGMLAYSDTSGLSLVADSGEATVHMITHPDTGSRYGMHHGPLVLPDGETVLFENIERRTTLGIGSLSDGSWRNVDLPISQILGLADGQLVYLDPNGTLMRVPIDVGRRELAGPAVRVAGSPDGVRTGAMAGDGTLALELAPQSFQLQLVDEQGVGAPLVPDTLRYVVPRYAPDGTRAAIGGSFRGLGGLWLYDFRNSTLSSLSPGSPFSLEWAPDGTRILFNRFAGHRIQWIAADASDTGAMLYQAPNDESMATASLSPDGRSLVIGTHLGRGGSNIMVASVQGDSSLLPLAAGTANESSPRLSRNGRWLAYVSDESGGYEVYVRPFPGSGARTQVSDGGGTEPVWSLDGRRLFYRAGLALLAADLDLAGGSVRVLGRVKLFEGDFQTAGGTLRPTYDVAPDGRHFLMGRAIGEARSDIVVWVNWLNRSKTAEGSLGE